MNADKFEDLKKDGHAFVKYPRLSAVISIDECNTSDLIMDEEVRAWQRQEERVCLMNRRRSCGRGGRLETV
jgi:hypothetical protein